MAQTTRPANSVLGTGKPSKALYGSDLMVEMLRELGIHYIALNPGASYRGLHDSLVNFGEGGPEILMCAHEEFAVAMANGYARVTGKPMCHWPSQRGRPSTRSDGNLQRLVRPRAHT